MFSRPLVLAHRGANRHARENTVEAFVRARALGADGVELDVRRTADGVLVVHHDPALDPVGLLVAQRFAELRAALPWLPTLAEALDACAGWLVNVEVKCSRWEPDADPENDVARAAVDLVRARELDVVFSSFDLATVDAVRAYAPELPTAFLVHGSDLETAAAVARSHGHQWLHPDRAAVLAGPDEAMAHARRNDLHVDVWTVDDPDEMRVLAAAGVDAIITNVPDVALEALG
jgi:glycerophosphoryl diester phosphodiesterase